MRINDLRNMDRNKNRGKSEHGRSMIEMLGVLAIVGVLSVAGIAGYAKAMRKYRTNQTIDILSQVVANLYEITQTPMGTTGDNSWQSTPLSAQDMADYGIYPECKSAAFAGRNLCQLPSGMFEVYYDLSSRAIPAGHPNGQGFIMVYLSSADKTNECIDILSAHWENVIPFDMFQPHGSIKVAGSGSTSLYSVNANTNYNKLNYTQSEIATACRSACETSSLCMIRFFFRC